RIVEGVRFYIGREAESRPEKHVRRSNAERCEPWLQKRAAEVLASGSSPRKEGADSHQEKKNEAKGDHPAIVERGPYRDLLTTYPTRSPAETSWRIPRRSSCRGGSSC